MYIDKKIILIHFVRNRSRIKNTFTSGHFELCLFKIQENKTSVIIIKKIGI
jgi:hypothetical protein